MPNPRAQKNPGFFVGDAITKGLLPMIGNAARGSVAATLGAPGDILGLLSDKQPLPTSQNILDYIPPVGSDKALTGMAETMGGFVPTPGSAGLVRAAKTVANPMTYGRAFMEAQAPAVMSPITAWHGSPHKFRKFDNSKMGTGEGAQAYGAGAYLADNQNIAKGYQEALSGFTQPYIQYGSKKVAGQDLTDVDLNVLKYLEKGKKDAGSMPHNLLYYAKQNAEKSGDKLALEKLNEFPRFDAPKFGYGKNTGYLYKVDVPDEAVANMLLWDKPLSEQPESVKKSLEKAISLMPPERQQIFKEYPLQDFQLGKDIKEMIGERLMNQAGIPGIRYLDAGSRGQGAGTMNTVVFDDSIIKILERNGVPLGLLAD